MFNFFSLFVVVQLGMSYLAFSMGKKSVSVCAGEALCEVVFDDSCV